MPILNPRLGRQSGSVELRTLGIADLGLVASVHGAAFPDSALTCLGTATVIRYYRWQLLGPHDVYARAALVEGRIVGFCFGGAFKGAITGFVRRNVAHLALRTLLRPKLMWQMNPRRALRRVLALLLPSRSEKNGDPASPKSFGILSLAAHPDAQGTGVGSALLDDAEQEARRRGYARMHLTVRTSNARGVRFYEKHDWVTTNINGEWTQMIKDWHGE